MPKKKFVAFEEILKQPGAKEAWAKLNTDPEIDHAAVGRRLEALANQAPSFSWRPPLPRDARRLADQLRKLAERIKRMNLYFGSELPLADPRCSNLPEILGWYADLIERAAGARRKERPSSKDDWDRELDVVRLLDQSGAGRNRHYFEQAATLIQASYDAGSVNKTVTTDQLRHAYTRQSYSYRSSRGRKN